MLAESERTHQPEVAWEVCVATSHHTQRWPLHTLPQIRHRCPPAGGGGTEVSRPVDGGGQKLVSLGEDPPAPAPHCQLILILVLVLCLSLFECRMQGWKWDCCGPETYFHKWPGLGGKDQAPST